MNSTTSVTLLLTVSAILVFNIWALIIAASKGKKFAAAIEELQKLQTLTNESVPASVRTSEPAGYRYLAALSVIFIYEVFSALFPVLRASETNVPVLKIFVSMPVHFNVQSWPYH
jgi:hypothetical protein